MADEHKTTPWTPEQGARMVQRLGEREAFLASKEAANHPESLNLFFGQNDYRVLRGNPVYGYWDEGQFEWSGRHVAWDGIVPVARSARAITPRAWRAAFTYIAKQRGLVVDQKAPIRIQGACLAAILDPGLDEPNRGVVLELLIASPTGPFRYRFGMGKPTIEDAIGASLDWAVGFAMVQAKSGGHP
jgi:hypothetical protein